MLREQGRRSSREAAAAAGREKTCEQLPTFEPALGNGEVSSGHVDALTNATSKLDESAKAEFVAHEAELLDKARTSSVEAFERHCRDLERSVAADDGSRELERQRERNNIKSWIDKATGMGHLHAELDPESHAKVLAAINARLRILRHNGQHDGAGPSVRDPENPDMTYAQLEALAFVQLVTGSTTLDRRSPEVVVLIDLDTLLNGLREASLLCETSNGVPLPPSTIRRLCCDANVIPAVLNGDGEPVDVGRSQRLATPAQRRAILAMYRTCGFPGCGVSIDCCEIHHVLEWLDLGPTDLANMIPLCSKHHHQVHEGGWTLTLGDQRELTVHRPDGTIFFTGTTIDWQPTARAG